MRTILYAAAAATVMFINIPSSHATEGPWCASTNIGGETEAINCSLQSLAQCRQEVVSGNRGSCYPNPRFGGGSSYGARGRY